MYLRHAGVDPCDHDTKFPTLEPGRLLKQRRRCVGGRGTTRIAQGTAAPCAHHAKLRQPAMRAGLRVPRVLIAQKCRVSPLWGSIDPCLTTATSHPRQAGQALRYQLGTGRIPKMFRMVPPLLPWQLNAKYPHLPQVRNLYLILTSHPAPNPPWLCTDATATQSNNSPSILHCPD